MTDPVDCVARDLESRLDKLAPGQDHLRTFLCTYQRTTLAVGRALDGGTFEDPAWVERWDVVFAAIYLSALDAQLSGGAPPRPWRLAFDAPRELPALVHVLLGMNAHVNYDLPQALLAVISDDDFVDASLMARRRRDHERIDLVQPWEKWSPLLAASNLVSKHEYKRLVRVRSRGVRPGTRVASYSSATSRGRSPAVRTFVRSAPYH